MGSNFYDNKYLLMYYIYNDKHFDLYSNIEEVYERRSKLSNTSGYRYINTLKIIESESE